MPGTKPKITSTEQAVSAAKPPKKLHEVRVRMYRPGFGDCFLLTFKTARNKRQHMLIDFGCHQSHPTEKELRRKIAEDIRKTTTGRLHTLVVTHEHADHRSGFADAEDIFKSFKSIEEIWMPWTNDVNDPVVKELIKPTQKKYCLALKAAVIRLAADKAQHLQNLAGFQETSDCSTNWIWERLQGSFNRTRFLEPGDTIGLADYGVKIYVLGPAREMYTRKKFVPSNLQPGGSETTTSLALDQNNAFLAAAVNATNISVSAASDPSGDASGFTNEDLRELFNLSLPFDASRAVPIKDLCARIDLAAPDQQLSQQPQPMQQQQRQARQQIGDMQISARADAELDQLASFFKEHYGATDTDLQAWRQIDDDWLQSAAQFALALDSNVNLSSLVLAIELEETGQILLFPGDAELRSWRNWQHPNLDIPNALHRTTLYKVGHHGSHNATLMEDGQGLCLMDNSRLVALLPTDEAWARSDKVRWDMPYPPIYQELLKRTQGRVLRSDLGIPERPPDLDEEEWQEDFLDQVQVDERNELWIQYTIPV